MYCDQLSKFNIGLFMRRNRIKSYSEFLRLATFFLINGSQIPTKKTVWDGWEQEKKLSVSITDERVKAHSEVIKELKSIFKKGEEILKKIE